MYPNVFALSGHIMVHGVHENEKSAQKWSFVMLINHRTKCTIKSLPTKDINEVSQAERY